MDAKKYAKKWNLLKIAKFNIKILCNLKLTVK